ncbi:MAG: hypothetical protein ACI9W3_000650, partial [Marinoscillum sp.]
MLQRLESAPLGHRSRYNNNINIDGRRPYMDDNFDNLKVMII